MDSNYKNSSEKSGKSFIDHMVSVIRINEIFNIPSILDASLGHFVVYSTVCMGAPLRQMHLYS